MDSHSLSSHNHKAKPRKMKAIVKKSRFQIFLDLFYRAMEMIVVMVTVVKLCYQLVFTFESSVLASFFINRHLAFVLGNLIVVAIVAKCSFFVNHEHDSQRNRNDLYEEFVRESRSARGEPSLQNDVICKEKQIKVENEAKQSKIEKEAKQSTEENRTKQSGKEKKQSRAKQSTEVNRAKQSSEEKKQSTENQRETEKSTNHSISEKLSIVQRQIQNIAQNQESPRQIYQRSRSENLEFSKKKSCGKLKRSETERSANGFDCDDELRCKIESFIARQRRNQKDEEF